MDQITIVLVVFLLGVELIVFMRVRLDPTAHTPVLAGAPASYKLMRPAMFLFLFGIDLSMAFLPLHMDRLYEPAFGLSRDLVMGLPISAEFLCVGIALLISGAWLDRRGWQEPFICGVLLAAAGGLYSWLAPDALHLIASRAVVGLGYGLTLLAAQGFVIHRTDIRSKAQGLAHLFAGLYAGSIGGAATGAMMAERIGYETVFLAGSLILFAVIAYTAVFLRSGMEAGVPAAARPPLRAPRSTATVARFVRDRRVLTVVLLSSLPASVATVGFLNYFSPVYLSRAGVSESTIGRVLMLFGICLTLFGPTIGRYVDASDDKRLPIFLGSLLGGLAFLSFSVLQGVAATAVAVVLLGLSNGLVLSSQSVYVLRLEVSRALGEGKAMGIFRSTSRIGQMLGPIVFAWLVVATDMHDAVIYFGFAYMATALLFLLLAGSESGIALEKTASHELGATDCKG